MLLFLVSRVLSAAGAFLYPTYASYKTLSRRPASEADLERWLMYWCVLGTILALEYVAEWTVRWLPFYYLLKTLFLLYLALPHTRGATHLYTTQLHPRIAAHEDAIDAALRRARNAGIQWAQRRLRALVAALTGANPRAVDGGGVHRAAAAAPPPTLTDPVSGPAHIVYGLWRTYAPVLATFLQPAPHVPPSPPTPAASPPQSPPPGPRTPARAPPPSTHPADVPATAHTSALDLDRSALLARRRLLEAELAALPMPETPPLAVSGYLPGQSDDHGGYDEIGRDEAEDEGQGDRSTWRSWWWGTPDANEREKTE